MIITLPHEFSPRPYQHELNYAHFAEGKKRMVQILHRRGGKSKNAINFILPAALQRVGTYYHSFPELKQARNVIWKGIDKEGKRYLDHIPNRLIKKIDNSDMRIELINGSAIQLAGTDYYNSLMGGNPAGIIFDEYSLQNPMAWHYLRPILAENGGWALFIYTPRGKNHGYQLYEQAKKNPSWFVQLLGIDKTKNWDGSCVIDESIIEEERASGMPEELIQQEFYCSFEAAVVGAYYSKELDRAHKENRIYDFAINPKLPVFTAWDLGISDSTSIWFMQSDSGKLRLVNYYENNGCGIEHYIAYIKDFALKHGIKYARHFAPHDIEVREFITGLTRRELASKKGIDFQIVKRIGVQEGIQATRTLFERFHIHKTNCEYGIRCLQEYHRKYKINDSGICYGEEPNHNWASHGADAIRYLSLAWQDYMSEPNYHKPRDLGDFHP